jgi:hypothetical protein
VIGTLVVPGQILKNMLDIVSHDRSIPDPLQVG